MEAKECTKCKVTFSLDNFHKRTLAKDGYKGQCKECIRVYTDRNKNVKAECQKRWREENEQLIAEYIKNNKLRIGERGKNWAKLNVHKRRLSRAERRSKKLNATPSWTSQLQHGQIKSLYKQAVDLEITTGIPHHVDHFHPLVSKYICGLHIPINLQVLTAKENLSKSNKFQCYVVSDLDTNNLNIWEII